MSGRAVLVECVIIRTTPLTLTANLTLCQVDFPSWTLASEMWYLLANMTTRVCSDKR